MPALSNGVRLHEGDRVVWKLRSAGWNLGKVLSIGPDDRVQVVRIPATKTGATTYLRNLAKVVGVVCPRCGDADPHDAKGWLSDVEGVRGCHSCGYREER